MHEPCTGVTEVLGWCNRVYLIVGLCWISVPRFEYKLPHWSHFQVIKASASDESEPKGPLVMCSMKSLFLPEAYLVQTNKTFHGE